MMGGSVELQAVGSENILGATKYVRQFGNER